MKSATFEVMHSCFAFLSNEDEKRLLQDLESCPGICLGKTNPYYWDEIRHLQHLESCTGEWLGKNFPLLIGMRKNICKIRSNALEFLWVRLPFANGNETRRLQHLNSCSIVWLGKTFTLLMGMRNDV